MNSYNENLYSTVSTSLLNLELDEKTVKSQLDASHVYALLCAGCQNHRCRET